LWRALGAEFDPAPKLKAWKMPLYGGVLDVVESLFTCCKAPLPEAGVWRLFFLGLVAPPVHVFKGLRNLSASDATGGSLVSDIVLTVGSAISFYAFLLLHILAPVTEEGGLVGIAWTCYVAFVVVVSYVRHVMRVREGIAGNGVEDFFAALLFYPQVLAQIALQAEEPLEPLIVKTSDASMPPVVGSASVAVAEEQKNPVEQDNEKSADASTTPVVGSPASVPVAEEKKQDQAI